ncbi:hypothetical protein MKEN_01031400 [Mycena kentingensis (nom. inval.)]|nr:hypothetical protein MKEN_01031400 [Mycena kentingensis (nom. inval.)]
MAATNVPAYTSAIIQQVEDALDLVQPPITPERFFMGMLFPSGHDSPVLVRVPLKSTVEGAPRSPRDLDATWWLPSSTTTNTSDELSNSAYWFKLWPPHSDELLPHAYYFFYIPQRSNDAGGPIAPIGQPLNPLIRKIVAASDHMDFFKFRGNVLVVRGERMSPNTIIGCQKFQQKLAAAGGILDLTGNRNIFDDVREEMKDRDLAGDVEGIGNMSLGTEEVELVTEMVKCFIQERELGYDM